MKLFGLHFCQNKCVESGPTAEFSFTKLTFCVLLSSFHRSLAKLWISAKHSESSVANPSIFLILLKSNKISGKTSLGRNSNSP